MLDADTVRARLLTVWAEVGKEYEAGWINGERSLQAVLYGLLRAGFTEDDVKVFIEPRLEVEAVMFPDIVVTQASQIIAVLELKFLPQAYPDFEEDVGKLGILASTSIPFKISLNPATGKFSEDRFVVTKETVLGFAVVGKWDARAVNTDHLKAYLRDRLSPQFLHLWGSVGEGAPKFGGA